MCIVCPICKSKQIENIFEFKKNIKSPHRLECEVYQNFLNIVSSKTNLNTDIIDILYFKEELSDIVNLDNVWNESINNFEIKIPDTIVFKENYKKTLGFIFANIIQLNKGYHIHLTDRYNVEEYDLELLNKKEKYNVKLSIPRLATTFKENKILIMIEFNEKNCIPYDINLLNEEEKLNVLNKLNNIKEGLFIKSLPCKLIYEKSEDKIFFKEDFIVNFEDDIESIYKNMEDKIENFYNQLLEIYEPFKEENKCFFERALIELEMKDF